MRKNYFFRSLGLILAMTFLITGRIWSQVGSYGFQESSGTYAALVGGTNSTATGDDGSQNGIVLGFTFNFGGVDYTHFCINTNGWIRLGNAATTIGGGSWTNQLDPTAMAHEPLIAPYWDDHNRGTGSISYLVTGSAPNRVLEVNWNNVNISGGGSTGANTASFLVRLYETTNIIEFIYDGVMTPIGTPSASIGITDLTTYKSVTPGAPATASNSAVNNNITSLVDVVGKRYVFTGPPPAPSTPTQDPTPPTCSAGTDLTASGTPGAGITWYWQTASNGTSTATPYAGAYTVYANGTYYLRAFDATNGLWSLTSSSVTVSNFPLATDPPAPTADVNPSCAPTGSVLSVAAAPVGYEYYWQGTTAGGTSNALNASATYNATTSGTYYVAAYETATQCWSNTVGLAVVVDTYVPAAPTDATTNYNICTGTLSQMITASAPASSSPLTVSFGTNLVSTGTGAATFNVTVPALPAGATITSAQLQLGNVNAINGSWRSEIRVALSGYYTLAATQISALSSGGLISPDPVINLAGFPTTGGSLNLVLTESFDDFGVDDATFGTANLVINYTLPASTIAWYDASSGGNQIGTGSPFETIGTSVLPVANTANTYTFYAASVSGGCMSTSTLPITVNVTAVLADLTPVNVTCNGGDNGSFTLGTVQCGSGTFTYSVDGGAFGPIPTNLTAGVHTVIIDDAGVQSAPISLTITQPAPPSGGYATNVTYYNAQLGWTTTGNETSWTIIYGPAGFDPATGGTSVPGATNPYNLTGVLSAATAYDFYVFSECGPVPDTAGPFSFSTDPGFLTYDTQCGPGFIDIAATGTVVDFSADPDFLTDDREAGITLPYPIVFNGVSYNDMTIGINGGIVLGSTTAEIGYGMAAATPGTAGIYPFCEDLDIPFGNIYTEVQGVAPNRMFIVQWDDIPDYFGTDGFTFEVIFEESTGDVYYVYDDVNSTDNFENLGANAEIGVRTTGTNINISMNNTAYLTANQCAHIYAALCPNPSNLTALIYANDAILDWNPGLYGEGAWTLVYGPAGFDPLTPGAAIDTFNLISSDASFGNTLTQLTTYDVYIYSECQADNLTSPGLLYTFTTLPSCSNPSAFAGFTAEDVLDLAWNWTESDPAFPIDGFNISYVNGANNSAYDPNGTEVSYTLTGGDNFETITDASLIAGGVYQVYVQAVCTTGDTSTYVGPITLVMPLSNDTVCGADDLMVDGTVYTLNNTGATISLNEPGIAPPADGAQVTTGWANSTLNGTTWFTFQAPASGSMRINGTAINYNGQYAIYEATDCGDFATFSLVAANDDAIEGGSNAPNFTVCGLTPGNTYYLMTDGFNATTGNYSIALTEIDLEAGNMNPVTDICTGSNIDLFTTITGYDAGGTWSSDVAAANASITGSDFESNGLGYQVFNFEYRVIDGCAYDTIISQVQIYGPSNAGDDGSIAICMNDPFDLLSGLDGTADLNGTWYDPSDNALPGSAIDYATLSIPGSYNYDYIAGNGVCPNDTSVVVVTVNPNCDFLNVEEELFSGLSLYPNPSEGIVFIASNATQAFDYVVTDAEGRVVMDANNGIKAGQTSEINLDKVETGVYFIKVSNSQAERVFRVVIQ